MYEKIWEIFQKNRNIIEKKIQRVKKKRKEDHKKEKIRLLKNVNVIFDNEHNIKLNYYKINKYITTNFIFFLTFFIFLNFNFMMSL